jgi:hypothetical protein
MTPTLFLIGWLACDVFILHVRRNQNAFFAEKAQKTLLNSMNSAIWQRKPEGEE